MLVTIPAFGAYVYYDASARRKIIAFSTDAKVHMLEAVVSQSAQKTE
jgi:hypothetical protein